MWPVKKQRLKTSYYQSFLALIVVPILFIIILSIAVIRTMMVDSAVRNIKAAQQNIASTLGGEVKDVSLRLSHFVYVNNNEIMRNAAKTDTKNAADKYHYTGVLTESFNYAMVPVQDIVSAVFFMKDGGSTYMKDDLVLTDAEVKSSVWYQEALEDKNTVKIGFYSRNVTFSKKNAHTLTIAAGLSPDRDVDRDEATEMATLFVYSQVGNLIKDDNKDPLLGTTMLLDQNGAVIFDAEDMAGKLPETGLLDAGELVKHRIDGKNYAYVVSREPETGLSIVSIVEPAFLTREFNRVAAVIVLVMIFLFALFTMFSAYFLKDIIGPVHNTVEGMKKVEEGNLDVHIQSAGQAELRIMIHSFNRMTRRLKQLIEENKEQEQKKHEAEIRALQSQINPHFLVNSLNSIRFIAQVSKYDAIARMAEALIRILSCSFRSNVGVYTVREELEVLDGFIYLMQIRYSDGFEIDYEIEDSCRACLIPRLLLQPIVENSIVHGFSDLTEDMGKIVVRIWERDQTLYMEVWDNGKGMEQTELERIINSPEEQTPALPEHEEVKEQDMAGMEKASDHVSVGLNNVYTRLRLNYGMACGLVMESEKGHFTKTVISLPAVRGEEKE